MTADGPDPKPNGPEADTPAAAAAPAGPPPGADSGAPPPPRTGLVLLASVFVIATCGLVYELLFGALSTYLLGSSITHFSLVIGIFLSAMGLGSFLSRFFHRQLLRSFLLVEITVGVVGGAATLCLFSAFAVLSTYFPLLVVVATLVGTLVGLEIPLLIRILRQQASLRTALGNVLGLDYLGALAASLIFPLVLLPRLGLVRTGFLFGLLNVAVGTLGLFYFRHQVRGARWWRRLSYLAAAGLLAGLITAGKTTTLLEDMLYDDEIVLAQSTPYQRMVITRWRDDVRLFLDGNIQFSSVDEFRYHEALVHPALGLVHSPKRVLLLGAGDGLAIREVLKHPEVEQVDLVELDPEMTRVFSQLPLLVRLNEGSLKNPKVKIHHTDAQKFLEQAPGRYNAIIIDLPDPNNEGIGRLYTRSFYRLVAKHLTTDGVFVTQATSPFYATNAFWCIVNTIRGTTLSSAGGPLFALPYHTSVPAFGEWGFVLGATRPLQPQGIRLDVDTRHLSPELLPTLFVFPKDVGPRETPINRLDNQVLVKLYEKGFGHYNP